MPGVYPWIPGQAAIGTKIFSGPVGVAGLLQIQKGTYSFPPSVTAPGTVASGGTVANTTGVDCWVYASATTGISAVKVVSYNGANSGTLTPAGTVPALGQGSYFVPGPGAIIV